MNNEQNPQRHAVAYSKWLADEIQEAIDDLRLNLSHDDVMTKMDARIAIALSPELK